MPTLQGRKQKGGKKRGSQQRTSPRFVSQEDNELEKETKVPKRLSTLEEKEEARLMGELNEDIKQVEENKEEPIQNLISALDQKLDEDKVKGEERKEINLAVNKEEASVNKEEDEKTLTDSEEDNEQEQERKNIEAKVQKENVAFIGNLSKVTGR